MKIKATRGLSAVLLFSLVLVLTVFAASETSAETLNKSHPNMVLDNFADFAYRTPWTFYHWNPEPEPEWDEENEPYWWTVTNNGWYESAYNQPCSSTGNECVTHETEGDEGFMRITVRPFTPIDPAIPEYHGAGVMELNTGFAFFKPKRWKPEPGRPVTLIAKLRWSDAYNADGTGDFVGSSGIYLWNMPIDYENLTLHEVRALGIELISDDSEVPEVVGLGVTVLYNDGSGIYELDKWDKYLYYGVDIHDWVELKMTWYEDEGGQQSAKFWINEDFVAEHIFAIPFPALAFEVWNDNYVLHDEGNGTFSPHVGEFETEQYVDLDFVKVKQN
jgi:hypothetical protein